MQKNEDVEHQGVRMYCTKNQFPPLSFCGTQNKPHGAHRLGKNYHICFDTKLRHGTFEIRCIPYGFTKFKSILDKTWSPGVPPHQQPGYKPVTYCTYSTVSGSFNN